MIPKLGKLHVFLAMDHGVTATVREMPERLFSDLLVGNAVLAQADRNGLSNRSARPLSLRKGAGVAWPRNAPIPVSDNPPLRSC